MIRRGGKKIFKTNNPKAKRRTRKDEEIGRTVMTVTMSRNGETEGERTSVTERRRTKNKDETTVTVIVILQVDTRTTEGEGNTKRNPSGENVTDILPLLPTMMTLTITVRESDLIKARRGGNNTK